MWPHYRTHDVLQREGGSTNGIIMACIAAFPTIWVRSTDFHEVPLTESLGLSVMSVCTFRFIFHGLISIISILLHSHILYVS